MLRPRGEPPASHPAAVRACLDRVRIEAVRADWPVRPPRRSGDCPLGRIPDVLQSDEHRRGCARPRLGGGGGELPRLQHREAGTAHPSCWRPNPHPDGHERRWPGRLIEGVRAGQGSAGTSGPRGNRQPRDRFGVATPDRLHGRRRRRHTRQERDSAHRFRRVRSRPRPARARLRPRRALVLQHRQRRPACGDRPIGVDAARREPVHRRHTVQLEKPGRHGERRRTRLDGRARPADRTRRHAPDRAGPQLPQRLRARGRLVRRSLAERQRRSGHDVPDDLADGGCERRLFQRRWLEVLAGRSAARAGYVHGALAPGGPRRAAGRRQHRRRRARRRRTLRGRPARRPLPRPAPQCGCRPQRDLRVSGEDAGRRLHARALRVRVEPGHAERELRLESSRPGSTQVVPAE